MSQPESTVKRQPWLHETSICVNGNITVLSAPHGDIEAGTVHGAYVDDRRVLSRLEVQLGGESPAALTGGASGARAQFLAAARNLGNPGPDPTVEVRRSRVLGGGLTETLEVLSRADEPVSSILTLRLAGDGADIAAVKAGHVTGPLLQPELEGGAVTLHGTWHRTTVALSPAPSRIAVDATGVVTAEFALSLAPGRSASVQVRATASRTRASALDADPGSDAVSWADVAVRAQDQRLERVVTQGLDDLRHLLLRDPEAPGDVFAGAGTPWYLTLFGRDSIWAARMLLPFGTELAAGTLATLARRQGKAEDRRTGEQPGKIPHELRRTTYRDPESGMELPPVYYGTVDATALWVTLLAEAWDWGMPADRVAALMPALQRAVGWLTDDARPDPDGFLKYLDPTGTGLANQGWKDSGDSIRWRDGHLATAPIALVEAQAYTVEALRNAARLLRAHGLEGADAAEASAADLAERLQAAFWVDTDAGHYLALALDAEGRAVDGLASNMGHVLGTGVLEPQQSRSVAAALTGPEMLDQFGVRTLGSGNGGFNPIGYHTGSIWTHDTAIAAWGLGREGHGAEAAAVSRSLLAAAEVFGYRWPELYSGEPVMGRPAPYPASCRPQAWSAASAAVLVTVALGLQAGDGGRALQVRPLHPAPFGPLRVDGLRLRGVPFAVELDAGGSVAVTGLPADVRVDAG